MIEVAVEIVSDIIEVAVEIATGGVCEDATITNSDNSYNETVASGGTFELPDQTINVFLDGNFQGSQNYPAMTNPTVNILWT